MMYAKGLGTEQDPKQALKYYEEAISMLRKVGDRGIEGITLSNLSGLYSKLGKKEQARTYYEEALKIFKDVGDRWEEGRTLYTLGKLYFNQEYYEVALSCFLVARGILEEVQNPDRGRTQRWIDNLRNNVGDERFATLLAEVEPKASEIVEKALQEGLS